MLFPSFETIISSGGTLIIFILMLSNGFFSFPSSQILYITAGVFIAKGNLPFLPVLFFGALANTLGNYFLFYLTTKHGEHVVKKFLPIDETILFALKETFKEKSLWWLALGKMTPSLKVAIPVLAGIAKTKKRLTALVFFVTSLIWAATFLSLGMLFGKSFSFGLYGSIVAIFGIFVALFFIYSIQKKVKKME